MSQGRRKHSPDCRAKVALEAMRGEETAAQPAARHQVHSSQSQAWKKALTDGAAGVLGNGQEARRPEECYRHDEQLSLAM